MKSRLVLTVAGATALVLALVGCGASGGSGAKAGPVKLEFQTGQAVDSAFLKTLTSVTKKYEAAHPNVTIDLVPATQTYEADMKVRLASGNVPDMWWTHGWSLLRYSKFLVPLQNEAWAKNFNPALAPAMKNSSGQFFAFPVDTDVAGIIYNKDVLAAAGVKASDIKTWDDFGRAAAKIKAAGIAPISSSGKAQGPAGNLADWIAAGAYSKSQLSTLKKGTWVDAPYTHVLDLIATWQKQGLFNPDYVSAAADDISRALATGKAAFAFGQNTTANDALQYNPKANLGYFPVPSLTGGSPYLIGGEMNAFGISKTSKNVPVAKSYIGFLAQPANATVLAKAAGSIPGLTNVKPDLGVLQSSYDSVVKPGKVPLVPYFDRVYLPNGMWNTMVTTADAVVTGGSSKVSSGVASMASDFATLSKQSQ
ncbi:MAG: raffinose/stachyose/melibiose transport system substrate-binding protein [Microbacteriaceae bacterium]|jgi:raffinose/stachyose/melibiose transport system substrate-binding protein|nr:raffinose/stachyose/melibiose transport system substrate-binding protein [Microbacteriaceae bacterium]